MEKRSFSTRRHRRISCLAVSFGFCQFQIVFGFHHRRYTCQANGRHTTLRYLHSASEWFDLAGVVPVALTNLPKSITNPFHSSHGIILSLGCSLGTNANSRSVLLNHPIYIWTEYGRFLKTNKQTKKTNYKKTKQNIKTKNKTKHQMGSFSYGTRTSVPYMEWKMEWGGGTIGWSYDQLRSGKVRLSKGWQFLWPCSVYSNHA